MANKPLQDRAGRNIGIENGPTPFVQALGSRTSEINPVIGSEVVILECPEDTVRSLQTFCEDNGMLFNKTANVVVVNVFFEDALGNRMYLDNQTVAGNDTDSFNYGVENKLLILNPGEKIVLVTAPVPPPP